jgi:hypothetical protein
MNRFRAGCGTLLLTLLPGMFAGCSGESDLAARAAKLPVVLDKSEYVALKKAGKSIDDIEKEKVKKKIAQMKERGIPAEIKSSVQKNARPR